MTVRHQARLGRSYDMGTFNFGTGLTGSTARARFGTRTRGEIAGQKRLELTSSSPPAQGVFQWTAATGELKIDLHQSQIDTIGVGGWVYEIDIIRSTGEVLEGPSGPFLVRDRIPD